MNTATIIENKGVLLSILNSPENTVLATALENETNGAISTGVSLVEFSTGVSLVEFSTGDYAVLDKSQEGTYITYLFDSETAARDCFKTCAEQWWA